MPNVQSVPVRMYLCEGDKVTLCLTVSWKWRLLGCGSSCCCGSVVVAVVLKARCVDTSRGGRSVNEDGVVSLKIDLLRLL